MENQALALQDVPNAAFRQLVNPLNENKCVTHSRDCQEIAPPQGYEMMKYVRPIAMATA